MALGLSLAVGSAAGNQVTPALETCIAALFAQETAPRLSDNVDLPERCPDLAALLHPVAGVEPHLAWAAEALSDAPSVAELLDMQALLAPPTGGAELQWAQTPTQLAALLNEILLEDDQSSQLSWWDRFLAWLRDLIKTQEDTDLGWLEKLLDTIKISEETLVRILYGLILLVILSFVAVFVNELRVAGLFRNKRRADGLRGTPATSSLVSALASRPDFSLSAIRDLAPQRQPAAILRLCIAALIAHGRLPDDRSRTNHELHRALTQDQAAASFGVLVNLAEDASYGGYPVSDQVLARCYAGADTILGIR